MLEADNNLCGKADHRILIWSWAGAKRKAPSYGWGVQVTACPSERQRSRDTEAYLDQWEQEAGEEEAKSSGRVDEGDDGEGEGQDGQGDERDAGGILWGHQ